MQDGGTLSTMTCTGRGWGLEQAFEIQSQYAKKAYDLHVAETSKLSEMYVTLLRSAYKPVEQAVSKKAA